MNEPKEQAMQADTRTIPEERAEFEEFASGKLNLQLMDNGIYFNGLTQCCWEAWKAARSTVRAPVDAPSVAHIEVHDGGAIEYGLTKDAHRLPPGIYRLYASAQEAVPQQGQWRPIESAPKDGKTVLIAEDGYVDCGFWHDGSECYGHRGGAGWFSEDNRHGLLTARNIHPTHWMPLPLPPASLQQHDQQEGA